jgi:hypothetical protein
MNKRRKFFIGLGIVASVATYSTIRILSLPDAPLDRAAPPILQEEINATISALKPPKSFKGGTVPLPVFQRSIQEE